MNDETNNHIFQTKSIYQPNFVLLISNLILLAMQPYILSIGNPFWVLGILTCLLLAGVWINKWGKKKIIIKFIIVILNVVCTFLYFYFDTKSFKVVYIVSILLLMLSTLLVQFLSVLKTKKADSSIVFSSINFYLISGYTGACFAWLIEILSPGSFIINNPVHSHQLFDFVYFSFVTMATLGYGDIIPSNESGKTLAVFISLFGQLYITIFLSIIISKFIKQQEE